jgi:siroheme decarboxylase
MSSLSAFDKRLCNELQRGLPIAERPFAILARILNTSENEVIKHTRSLVKLGVIRRIGVSINWRAIGKASTLVAAHIEQDNLKKVIPAVNKLQGVSHNYLREHHYNLWFTLRADSQKDLEAILKKFSKRFGTAFNSLPVTRVFKLDARFDATSDGKRLLSGCRMLNAERCELSSIDERILKGLQGGLKVVKRPFNFPGNDAFENYDRLIHISGMIQDGVINRLGAMVNHNKLGFTANAMFACKADKSRAIKIGKKLAALGIVSHCYERKIFKGWPYNIFAMMHGSDMRDIRKVVERFTRSQDLKKWELLPTAEKLKK